MSEECRQSPLAHRAALIAPDQSVCIVERPFFGKQMLRVNAEYAAKKKIDLPTANRVLHLGETQILWLGPDEWMFVTSPDERCETLEKHVAGLSGSHHQFVDVSDYYTIIRLSGKNSGALLMKLSTLDLHPRGFKSGDVVGSVFGKANAWLVKQDSEEVIFDLLVRWSMADYLWCLLAEAGREFGLAAQSPVGQEKGLRYKS